MSHKTVPGIRGPVITTAEQQLAPTSCSTLTVVTGGHASPQESTSISQHVLQSIPNLAQRQLPGAAEAPAQPQCHRRHHYVLWQKSEKCQCISNELTKCVCVKSIHRLSNPEGILSCIHFINTVWRQRTNLEPPQQSKEHD